MSACTVPARPQKYVSSTSSIQRHQSAAAATTVATSQSPSGSAHWTDSVLRSTTYQLTWLTTRSTAKALVNGPVQRPGRSLAAATATAQARATAANEAKYSAENIFTGPRTL